MRCSISQDDLRTILHEADAAARRLLWQLRLSRDDLEDTRQDLLADVTARLRGFDPDRGSLGAFAGAVMSHRATRIANKIKRERRLLGAVPISLDETIPDTDGLTRGDLVSEEESLSHHLGQQVDVFAAAEHRIDVERGLGLLDQDDRALCAACPTRRSIVSPRPAVAGGAASIGASETSGSPSPLSASKRRETV